MKQCSNSGTLCTVNLSYNLGTEVLETVRKLSKDVLLELFRDDKIAEDSSDTPEYPQIPVLSPSGIYFLQIL